MSKNWGLWLCAFLCDALCQETANYLLQLIFWQEASGLWNREQITYYSQSILVSVPRGQSSWMWEPHVTLYCSAGATQESNAEIMRSKMVLSWVAQLLLLFEVGGEMEGGRGREGALASQSWNASKWLWGR